MGTSFFTCKPRNYDCISLKMIVVASDIRPFAISSLDTFSIDVVLTHCCGDASPLMRLNRY